MTSKRRGVSPVIATLLLIVIAVAAAVLTYVWVTGYIGRSTGAAESAQVQERIKINAVTVSTTTSGTTVTVSVANIGDVKVNISAIYLLYQNGTRVPNCGGTLTTLTQLSPGSVSDIAVPGSCSLSSGVTYIAKVVTGKGTEATYTFTKQ
jgi:flagellin-like protein